MEQMSRVQHEKRIAMVEYLSYVRLPRRGQDMAAKRFLTYQELRALDLLDQGCQSGFDVGPRDPLLCRGVRDGLQALLVQHDDALEHTDLIQRKCDI
jgi:hypothetical protein